MAAFSSDPPVAVLRALTGTVTPSGFADLLDNEYVSLENQVACKEGSKK